MVRYSATHRMRFPFALNTQLYACGKSTMYMYALYRRQPYLLVVFPAVEELSVQLDAARRELLEDLHQVRAQPTPVKHVTSHEHSLNGSRAYEKRQLRNLESQSGSHKS